VTELLLVACSFRRQVEPTTKSELPVNLPLVSVVSCNQKLHCDALQRRPKISHQQFELPIPVLFW
jgi:hypothetical protein